MEVTIKNPSSRLILERADNGVILYDVGEDNTVSSRVVYEIYFKDGIIDFQNMAIMMIEILESLKIPVAEEETNRSMAISVVKIDPDKPALGEDDFEDEEDEDDDK